MALRLFIGMAAALLFSAAVSAVPALPPSTVVIDTPRGPVRFYVEVAADTQSQTRGLMYRTRLPADAGMLFDFHNDDFRAFWMKNTPLPLDMLFIRADGTISSIEPNTKPMSDP